MKTVSIIKEDLLVQYSMNIGSVLRWSGTYEWRV